VRLRALWIVDPIRAYDECKAALDNAAGNVTKASAALGIDSDTLWVWLRKGRLPGARPDLAARQAEAQRAVDALKETTAKRLAERRRQREEKEAVEQAAKEATLADPRYTT
jgi:hypothetical protein